MTSAANTPSGNGKVSPKMKYYLYGIRVISSIFQHYHNLYASTTITMANKPLKIKMRASHNQKKPKYQPFKYSKI